MAKVTPDMIDLFNCHATSTQVGDLSEAKCIASLLKAHQELGLKSFENLNNVTPEIIAEH